MTERKIDRIKDIPANPNALENGLTDPTPEKGPEGQGWRAWWSWVKGFGRTTSTGS